MESTPRLGLTYVMPQQAQKHLPINESFRRLDALTQLCVLSRSSSTPKNTPVFGDSYIISNTANVYAEWEEAQAGDIVSYDDGHWYVYTPKAGMRAFVLDEKQDFFYDGTGWNRAGSTASGQTNAPAAQEMTFLGLNALADAQTRLRVASDAVSFSHDAQGDLRLYLNRENGQAVASVLFQSAFQGALEMGLLREEGFLCKYSADGVDFSPALRIDTESGVTRFYRDCQLASINDGPLWPARNLLDNGGFAIAQRGESRIHDGQGGPACVDRWEVEPGDGRIVSLRADKGTALRLRIEKASTQGDQTLSQFIPAPARLAKGQLSLQFTAKAQSASLLHRLSLIALDEAGLTLAEQDFYQTGDTQSATRDFTIGVAGQHFEMRLDLSDTLRSALQTAAKAQLRFVVQASAASANPDITLARIQCETGDRCGPFIPFHPQDDWQRCRHFLQKRYVDIPAAPESALIAHGMGGNPRIEGGGAGLQVDYLDPATLAVSQDSEAREVLFLHKPLRV